MPYNSKPGARKYGNNPMKPAAPTAFKMRSGNGPLQFKQMGASPANFGESSFGQFTPGSNSTSQLQAGLSGKKDMTLSSDSSKEIRGLEIKDKKSKTFGGDAATVKDNKELKANKDAPALEPKMPAAPEKNWREKKSDFKDQKKDFRKTRKDFREGNKEEIAELKASGASKEEIKAAKKVNKQEQKDLKGAHKDDNKAAKQNYKNDAGYIEHRAQQKKELSEGLMDLGQSRTFQGKGAKSFVELQDGRDASNKAVKKADEDAKAKEIATADANKKDAINAKQKAEMHTSNLAKNAQDIERSKSLQKSTEQGIKVAEENKSKEKELGADENKSIKIIKGSGNDQKVKTALDK
jgi:hypothetical protein